MHPVQDSSRPSWPTWGYRITVLGTLGALIGLHVGAPAPEPPVVAIAPSAPPDATTPVPSFEDLEPVLPRPERRDLRSCVRQISEHRFSVCRAGFDRALGAPHAAIGCARIVPSIRDGRPNGFKLYRVRPSSLWAALGFRNGDILHSINGHDLTTPDKALEIYTTVRAAPVLEVAITRREQPLTLVFDILDEPECDCQPARSIVM